jgi:hypothetical protein
MGGEGSVYDTSSEEQNKTKKATKREHPKFHQKSHKATKREHTKFHQKIETEPHARVVCAHWLPWRVLPSTGLVLRSTRLFSGTMVLWTGTI